MDLREYEQFKFALADIVRSMSNQFESTDYEWKERFHELFNRLAVDRFKLAFIGRFSRGKSSLMNAIIGRECLPVGIVPLTSVITTVSYGSKDHVVLHFDSSMLTQEISISALPQFVTQHGNPGNVKRIKVADVQIRAGMLRRGFQFVDTPGLGSAIAANTRTTESFLPQADAFLLVTSFESPLSEEEIRILRQVSPSERKIFVVINKQDLVNPEQHQEVIAFVKSQLASIFGEETPQVFPLSARDGLEAKSANDGARLKDSGLADLEERLLALLLTNKAEHFLMRTSARIAEVANSLPKDKAGDVLQRLRALTDKISVHASSQRFQCVSAGGAEQALPPLRQFNPCEICGHIAEIQWNFLRKFQNALIVNGEERRRFSANRGLCGFHTWQLQSVASDYGLCMTYPDVLELLAARLRAETLGTKPQEAPNRIRALLPGNGSCILCATKAEAEAESISTIAARLACDEAKAMASLSAICFPHFGKLTDALEDPGAITRLLDHQATLCERLAEDMRRHALRYDARRRADDSDEDESAGKRALLILAGYQNVNPG